MLTKKLADASFADGATVIMDTAKYAVVLNLFHSFLLNTCIHLFGL